MEKFCPSCGRGYPSDANSCPEDGQRLAVVEQEPSLVGLELEGKYKLTAELGKGGMGSVYLAHQASMDREVAVKVLRRQLCTEKVAISRFLREARAASKLTHPNTIRVYDFGQTADGLLYMVMERLTGYSLADVMDEEGRLAPARSIHLLAQVCDSLAEAHIQGITHRDLKPENIFIEQKFGNPEHVKVLDFGIAKMANDANTQATATGMICGTPSYMSPEQALGKEIDGRSDIYALGILLYEMLAGQRPFEGDTAMEVMLKHLNAPLPPLPPEVVAIVPPGLVALVERMLAKKPEDRPPSCQAVKSELMACLGQAAPAASAAPKERATTRDAVTAFDKAALQPGEGKSPRRGLLAAALALVVVAGAVGVWWFALRQPGAPSGERLVDRPGPEQPTAQGASPAGEPSAASPTQAEAPVDAPSGPDLVEAEGPGPEVAGAPLAPVAEAPAPEVAEAPPEAPVEPPAAMVTLTIESTPPGAQIFDGDHLLGMTPLTFERAKDSGVQTFVLRLDGYKDQEVAVNTMSNLVQPVTLQRVVTRKAGGPARTNPAGPAGEPGDGAASEKTPVKTKKKFGVGTF